MATHNQFQFQQAARSQGLKLNTCECGRCSFPLVEYYANRSVRISCRFCSNSVTMQRDRLPTIKTEQDFIKETVTRWNAKNYDKRTWS